MTNPYAGYDPYPNPVEIHELTPEWFHRSDNQLSVNRISALSVPAIRKALQLRSDRAAKVPVDVFRNVNDGRKVASTHAAQKLLKLRPSKRFTPFLWRKQVCFEVDYFGNSFWYIERDELGQPSGLTWLQPDLMGHWHQGNEEFYVYDGKNRIYSDNLLHFKSLSLDTIMGVSPLVSLSKSIRLSLLLNEYQIKFFESPAGRVRLILKFPPHMQDPLEQQQYVERFNEFHSGSQNQGKVAGISNMSDIITIPNDNQAAEIVALSEAQIVAIANTFGVKPHHLGVKIGTSYASLIEENDSFLEDLDGFLTMFEQECSVKLLTERQLLEQTHFIECNRDAVRVTDKNAEEDRLAKQFMSGGIGWKERRKLKNWPTDTDDVFLIPANMIAVDKDMKPIAPPEPPPAPAPEAPIDQQDGDETAKTANIERALTDKIADKLVSRVKNSIEQKTTKHSLCDIARDLRQDHQPTFEQWLDAFPDGLERADKFFDGLTEELTHIQRSDVCKINWDNYRRILNAAI